MPDRPPNVLLVICDDLALGDLACHGNPHVRTPHLDALHEQSTRLTRYGSGPVCTPARAALMTGRYPYRTGAIDTYLGRSMMHADEVTLAELLRDAGYATCLSGKWHLGDCHPLRPEDRGFDEALYHLGGGLRQPANPDYPEDSYFNPLLMHNGEPERRDGYCSDVFTDHALSFIEARGRKPWFCYLAFNAPHSPFEVEDALAQPYRDAGLPETWARLYAMVENIDTNVGRALSKLDELGLADETVVVFTSDHGPCASANVDGKPRFNAGLRGIKGSVYEGGLRVPCFVRYPKRIGAGTDVDRIANPIDWLPTLASLCGATRRLPRDRAIDGVDLTPLLVGEASADDWPERELFVQWHRGDVPRRYRNAAVITQQYKWCRPGDGAADELYDVSADPGETVDLSGSMPERCDVLRSAYDGWFDQVSRTRGQTPAENYGPPRIVVGSDASPRVVLSQQDWRSEQGEHFMDDTKRGHWLIDVAEAGPYDITVRLPGGESGPELVLACGRRSLHTNLASEQITVRFANITLPTGPQRLDCFRVRADRREGVRFVEIEKRGR
jgi:arylsulfatase A-like enzyme